MSYLIIGSSSGLGRELAYTFAKNHNNLILVSRDERDLVPIKSDIEQTKQIKKICCFFKPCSITKIFCAPIAKIKLSPVKNPKIRYSI